MDESPRNERTSVNVVIDIDELDEIKALSNVDANATAIMAAARIGKKFLKKVNSVAESALLKVNELGEDGEIEKALNNV